ncbi:MAG: 3-phenylpropionate MFS transporter [Proteobacteria bacterium]|nr:3-phenylpropionate MFS transporter [Pseudomonadota bacterium]
MSELRAPTRASTRSLAFRYAAFYGAVFLVLGIYMPFWPVFLKSRGLDAAEIGLIFALVSWIRIVTTPAIAQIADRSGRAKATLVVVAALSLVFFIGFFEARGFWPILLVMLPAAVCFQPMIPLAESQTMAAVLRERLDYGRIRLWGSLAFILGTVGAGRLITGRAPDLVLYLMLGALGATVLAALALPGRRETPVTAQRSSPFALLGNRRFLLFLGAAGLLQASHAAYYGFSALHWKAAGLSEATIGALWAEGVAAEILLFAVSGAVVARVGPPLLLALAGLGGVLRWSVLAATTALPALVAVQALHALTFGAAHLAAMHFIARAAPPGLSATAQSLYTAISGGIAMGLSMLAAGALYQAYAGGAFLAMAALSAGGTGLALVLWRAQRRAGERTGSK